MKTISWRDADNSEIAYIGYFSNSNKTFEIKNDIANILIKGASEVDLGPAIKENGQLLSNKYVLKEDFDKAVSGFVGSGTVHTADDADKKFAAISKGFSQFIAGGTTKQTLRSQIDAATVDDVLKKAPALDKYLSDMATSEDIKKKICSNIGTTYGGDFQPKLKDSGWVKIKEDLYIRQIGNIVSIQGKITTIHHPDVLFTIPTSIDPPAHAVKFSTVTKSSSDAWTCCIEGKSRNCVVDYCNHHGAKIQLSITYMV